MIDIVQNEATRNREEELQRSSRSNLIPLSLFPEEPNSPMQNHATVRRRGQVSRRPRNSAANLGLLLLSDNEDSAAITRLLQNATFAASNSVNDNDSNEENDSVLAPSSLLQQFMHQNLEEIGRVYGNRDPIAIQDEEAEENERVTDSIRMRNEGEEENEQEEQVRL